MPPILLTGQELAEKIDESYPQILEWAREGAIPSIRVGGRVFFNLRRVVCAIRAKGHAAEPELATAS